jgi:hypothetical protein
VTLQAQKEQLHGVSSRQAADGCNTKAVLLFIGSLKAQNVDARGLTIH